MYVAELQQQISRIFAEELNLEVPSPDTDLVETGLLDSLTFVNLLVHLEQEFGVQVTLDDLDIDNLCSVEKIACFIVQRNGGGAVRR